MDRYHPAARMNFRRSVLALCAFFALGGVLSACGSNVPGNAVADVAGNPIAKQAFNHWMFVAAKLGLAQAGSSAPVVVPNDPPGFQSCVTQARTEIPSVATDSTKTLQQDCSRLFDSLKTQALGQLISSYWQQAEAAKQHITVSNAEVQTTFERDRTRSYPTPQLFNSFLQQSGYTVQDLTFLVRIQLLYQKLVAKHTKSVTNAQIAAYYASHLSQFGTAQSRNLRIVLTKTRSQAVAAKKALASGQSWNTVAKRYSIDPATKDHGGVLDNVSEGQTDQALQAVAFSAPLNHVLGPIQGQFGYYVVEVTKIVRGTQKSIAQATPQIRQTLSSQAQSAAQNAVNAQAQKDWLSQTHCRSAYAIASYCSGYKAPKSSTTTTG